MDVLLYTKKQQALVRHKPVFMGSFFKTSNSAHKCRGELMTIAKEKQTMGTKSFKLFALYKTLKPGESLKPVGACKIQVHIISYHNH